MTEQQSPDTDVSSPTPQCPKCSGDMWDNRVGKRNPKAPDFKCKDKECDGVIWPPRDARPAAAAPVPAAGQGGGIDPDGMPLCPICGGAMWDDRLTKRNPKAPDFKCRNKPKERGGPGCEGVIWPSRDGSPSPYPDSAPRKASGAEKSVGSYDSVPSSMDRPPFDDAPPHDDDDLPF